MKTVNCSAVVTLCAAFVSVASQLGGAPLPCPGPPPPSIQVANTPPATPIVSPVFSCGGLTFSNFSVVDAGTTNPISVVLVSASLDSALGYVYLNFNPNLFAPPGVVRDIHFYFQVDGGINGIDLSVGGNASAVFERACSTVIDINSANGCTGGLVNQLATLTNSGGASNVAASFATTSPVYLYKDVLVDGRGTASGSEVTSFTQSFHFGGGALPAEIPEPSSTMLMGTGLLGLAAVIRRLRSRQR